MTRINAFGNRVLAGVAQMLFKEDITDLCTAFWGRHDCVVDRIDLVAQRFKIEADMFMECARHGFDTRKCDKLRRTHRSTRAKFYRRRAEGRIFLAEAADD